MSKNAVIYWSGTGNTEAMATLIARGAEADLFNVNETCAAETLGYDVIILGCPAMGDEVLEESEFEPFFTELEGQLAGKKVALFGSYGWGDGQWMRDWEERVKSCGAVLVCDGLMVNEAPDDEDECIEFGKNAVK